MEKILPCPFCGSYPKIGSLGDDNQNWAVWCNNCKIPCAETGINDLETKNDIIKAWNTRKLSNDFGVKNVRYILWMLYRGIYDPPEQQYEYINWLNARKAEFEQQNEFKDFDKYLMYFVRDFLVRNCSVAKDF